MTMNVGQLQDAVEDSEAWSAAVPEGNTEGPGTASSAEGVRVRAGQPPLGGAASRERTWGPWAKLPFSLAEAKRDL